ncbi:hypothetical protein EVAR_36898_1 [Eumeta japonica]|uniref:Uncharacterized protein n=1 Tax=Eumeta variegata TaxID=151549 RepID=A0A4C1WV88_EUMVA|nr:hypothetical protein EVAR_36898_1 [Eumeta japonica]
MAALECSRTLLTVLSPAVARHLKGSPCNVDHPLACTKITHIVNSQRGAQAAPFRRLGPGRRGGGHFPSLIVCPATTGELPELGPIVAAGFIVWSRPSVGSARCVRVCARRYCVADAWRRSARVRRPARCRTIVICRRPRDICRRDSTNNTPVLLPVTCNETGLTTLTRAPKGRTVQLSPVSLADWL